MSKYVGVGHSGTINSAVIAPDQTFIVSVGEEGAIFIWSMPPEICEKCHEVRPLFLWNVDEKNSS